MLIYFLGKQSYITIQVYNSKNFHRHIKLITWDSKDIYNVVKYFISDQLFFLKSEKYPLKWA